MPTISPRDGMPLIMRRRGAVRRRQAALVA
jgi:hypothetical protein